jgi:hypothetical protein
MVSVPDISVRIRKRAPYAPLSSLGVKQIGQNGKVLHIRFESKGGDVVIRFQLDFGAERLNFSLFHDLGLKDTGTPESAETIAEVRRFESEDFGNGQLHICQRRHGRSDRTEGGLHPHEYIFGSGRPRRRNRALLAEQRRDCNKLYAEEMVCLSVPYEVRITGPAAASPTPAGALEDKPTESEKAG